VYAPFLVGTMTWTGEHHTFVVEEYIRNGGSAISSQRAFCISFQLGRHDFVPDKKKQCLFEPITLMLDTQTRFRLNKVRLGKIKLAKLELEAKC